MIEYAHTLLDALFEHNSQACLVFDRGTLGLLAVNRAACVLYGYTRGELLTMSLRELRPAEDIPRLEHVVAAKRHVATNFTRLSRHRARDGRVFDCDVEIRRVMFEGREASLAVVTDVSALSEVEQRYRTLVETAVDGMSVNSPDGHVMFMNAAGERLLGFLPGELVGRSSFSLANPEDAARVRVPAPGEVVTNVVRTRCKDGVERWFESNVVNMTLDPAIRGFISAFRDITPRVEAERALRAAQSRLEFLLSATLAVTYTARAVDDFTTTYISPNVRDVLGWEPAQFCDDGRFWRARVHPEDRDLVATGLAQLFEHGGHELRYRIEHADGSYRWILDSARLHRDGDTAEVVGYVIDITARTHAEQALARSEASFRSVIERSPTMTFVHNDGIVMYANRAMTERLGFADPSELVGVSAFEYIHPEDRAAVGEQIARTALGDAKPIEIRMLPRDGVPVIVEAAGVRVDFNGKPAHVVFCTDISARRELYARMAVADRLVSLGTLAAGVAHEINNPLAYVIGNIELLARELPALVAGRSRLDLAELEALLTDAREGAARVGAIVRDLRALSRSDDGRATAVDVVPVLQSCLKMVQGELRDRARIVEDLAPGLPQVAGTASRLGQVFLNLLVNAAHAIPEGRPETNEVRVSARAEADLVVIEIADSGGGIPARVIGRIFDPFFTTKPVGQGTGLGLAISHEIVRSLGGTITVDSTVGRGTIFRIALPVAKRSTATPPFVPKVSARARVLLIDDEIAVGRSIHALLAPDIEVVAVTHAAEALERIARGEQFDAILCDLMMPEVGGAELYRRLARDSPAAANRLVFMSGGAPGMTPPGDRPLLEKPFTEGQLRAAIERVTSAAARA
jgi:two-component system cell cycle sensor histidine kinase/response regulator CckA